MVRCFDELDDSLSGIGVSLPGKWRGHAAHLDPDFGFLSYGDQGARARRIEDVLGSPGGGFIAFYAALRDVQTGQLVDALIGIFDVAELVAAEDVPSSRWHENAHTRRCSHGGDIIVRGAPGKSGRLTRCIVIGRYRDRAHRVDTSTLNAWGGLTVRDGYIQRSARLPEFQQPQRFIAWLRTRKPKLSASNNPP